MPSTLLAQTQKELSTLHQGMIHAPSRNDPRSIKEKNPSRCTASSFFQRTTVTFSQTLASPSVHGPRPRRARSKQSLQLPFQTVCATFARDGFCYKRSNPHFHEKRTRSAKGGRYVFDVSHNKWGLCRQLDEEESSEEARDRRRTHLRQPLLSCSGEANCPFSNVPMLENPSNFCATFARDA